MMKVKQLALVGAVACLMGTSPAAAGPLGGFGKALGVKLPGTGATGSEAPASGDDADQFLANATRSTKNVMIAAAILAQAITNAKDLTSQKSYIDAITNAQDSKELDAHRAEFQSNLDTINSNKDIAASIQAGMKVATAQQREMIGIAVINMGIGIARNVDLAASAPRVVGAVSHNVQLLTRVGQFKVAAALIGMQAKGLAGVATSMPKLISATKVSMPANPKQTEPKFIPL